jgi:hypothetical protein
VGKANGVADAGPEHLKGLAEVRRLDLRRTKVTDASCAWEKKDKGAFPGYTRKDAAQIGLNALLYSMQQ